MQCVTQLNIHSEWINLIQMHNYGYYIYIGYCELRNIMSPTFWRINFIYDAAICKVWAKISGTSI